MTHTASATTSSLLYLAEYVSVEQLYASSRTLVYRAVEPFTQRPVIIKLLNSDYPNFSELLQFRNQYTIAKSLDLPGIVRPYSLEPYGNSYALVMEDFGGISLRDYAQTQSLSLQEVLTIALQLAEIFHDLHQQRVIYKDLKPAHILIHPDTKQIKLIDFSIASLLPRETQAIQNPTGLEGTLAYLAPEQTGRMNRGIDYRSDFYAFGVTLYELLTGQLPFQSDDPMELVHCHLAKVAIAPHEVQPTLPTIVSNIVLKLMAKNAEERYQSAWGLRDDLETCLHHWKTTGTIAPFELGMRDLSDRFIIPEKLYGREAEVKTLLEAFERASHGASELMLIAGFSGIGKTAIVTEVHKPIVKQRGYFIKGKFDQFNRTLPFSAFVQAFRNLMGQLLSESDGQLQIWKTNILKALGDSAQVIIEVIPELERILGKQPLAPELSGIAAQNRFNLLFQKFIQVFTTPEHPLVMVLDDLQWADAASLRLLNGLLSEASSRYLLILGAYRDNEVFPAHPLMLTLEQIQKAQATVHTLTLSPLVKPTVNQLVADTLRCPEALAHSLTQLVYQKTQGNPFFTTQFLKALHAEGWIQFQPALGYWQYDLTATPQSVLTDNVVEFMAMQLQKLPVETQEVLKLAACIGNQFDLNTLAIVSEQLPTATAAALWRALQDGLILPISETYKFFQSGEADTPHPEISAPYKFFHDRVQQAAYTLIPNEQKQATHLAIGRLLQQNIPDSDLEGQCFEIVNHWNRAIDLLVDPVERITLAHLNLTAGRKAKASIAYEAALKYFKTGLDLLGAEHWQTHYGLTLALHEGAAETAYLCGQYSQMEHWSNTILHQAQSELDTVKIYEIKILANIAQQELLKAVETGLQALKQLGVHFPQAPTQADVAAAIAEVTALIPEAGIAAIADLPPMSDAHALAILQLANGILPAANIAAPPLFPLVILEMTKQAMRFGNSPLSSVAYSVYGTALCAVANNPDAGYQFGKLALETLSGFHAPAIATRVLYIVAAFIAHWKIHPREMLPLFEQSIQQGLNSGNFEDTAWSYLFYSENLYFLSKNLSELEHQLAIHLDALHNLQHLPALKRLELLQNHTFNLLGRPAIPEGGTPRSRLPESSTVEDQSFLFCQAFYQLSLFYLQGDYDRAFEQTTLAATYADSIPAQLYTPFYYFYDSLVRLAFCDDRTPSVQLMQQVQVNQEKMQHWANHAPMNHQHKVDLVEAEKCRVLGQHAEAIERYDRAIAGAKANGYLREEAIANELAAKFYLAWGKEKVAAGYLQDAYYAYARWGANAKTEDLETRYPELLLPMLQSQAQFFNSLETLASISARRNSTGAVAAQGSCHPATQSSPSVNVALDFAAILKASQSLSSTIQLDQLLLQLTQIILQNSGGDRCALILLNPKGVWHIRAIATPESTELCTQPLEGNSNLPVKLIQYVKNTQEQVVIDDLKTDLPVLGEYLYREQPKSALGLPILNQGNLIGILYLQNQATSGVFTADRILILNFLCTQAAIALENARLYQKSQQYARELEHSLAALEQSQIRYHHLTKAISQIIWVASPQGENLDTVHWMAYTGQTQAEVEGTGWLSALHPDDLAHTTKAWLEAVETKSPYHTEYRIRGADGIYRYFEVRGIPVLAEDGTVKEWIGACTDIDARWRAEAELQQKSQALELAIQELQNAQLQMVQSEKMASLGNLVAGVAHEINNPIGFLNGSINNAKDYLQDFLGHLELYQQHYPNPTAPIQDNAEEIDLEFLCQDLPTLFNSMKGAVDRIKSISTSLRTFSRADTENKVSANLHEGIDSTVLILKYRLKANQFRPTIQVMQEYGKLPQIECFPGQLNQVFMNILANAIDMFDEMAQEQTFAALEANPQQITIRTAVNSREVMIYIADNGKGMSEDVRSRIFDHLFTTKGVGKGTGLGLAIAQQIVEEKHQGSLEVQSELGKGTEFCIRLPLLP